MNSIFKHIETQYNNKLPFVAYKKPLSTNIYGHFQKTNELLFVKNFIETGFVFAPFNTKNNAVFFPKEKSEFIVEKLNLEENLEVQTSFIDVVSTKENYIKLIEKAISEINKKRFKKVVVSRKEKVQLSSFDLVLVFKKLLQEYPNAMVYVWFHPKVGLWLGATPETLLKVNQQYFETMALAGTQTNTKTPTSWKPKEIKEQQLVTDYIVSNLQPLVDTLEVSNTQTVKAGNLLHLKTTIKGKLKNKNLELITKLHPTPAVCGLPMQASKEFVLSNENYKRSFYTGFLGELNTNNSTEIFVNLRCMEIINKEAYIYVGGGITKDSNPEKEWEETVAKTRVMKKVL